MRRSFPYAGLLFFFSLAACAPPSPRETAKPILIDAGTLRAQLATLPGAEVDAGPEIRLVYPGEVLFASGAALPFPGGIEILDPLAELIAANPAVRWTGTVRASGGTSQAQDLALALKRSELLERYFVRRGLDKERLFLTAVAEDGAPLQLRAELPPPIVPTEIKEEK